MPESSVAIVQTGVANTASVAAALERCGVRVSKAQTDGDVERAAYLALPGVGSFGAGMEALQRAGLVDALRARIEAGRPTLAICLGMQLLCSSSEESPGAEGLGVIDARVEALSEPVRPRFGWNRVVPDAGCDAIDDGYAYYANSFGVRAQPSGWACAMSELEAPFVGALQRGSIVACQFHPELSGPWGLGLLKRWMAAEVAAC
ncbi:MAG: imidazole glycerol phosphate synthase subunit HisH [Phycisphaerales bacterium]|jgi:glutamine amidotransferase